ncbi:MAG: 50S ribosomal protein L32 [Clostridia bacterium]|nr:50S ribosomal protein L32 [Clostridia bacterium]
MGLFDKKYCDVCGEKIGLLGNRKLEDGNLCKHCANKLSYWFDDRRRSTVAQIKEQLAYREENLEKVKQFNITRVMGRDTRVVIDEDKGWFMVARTGNYLEENPDVLEFSQVTGCDFDVDEDRGEHKRQNAEGEYVSYIPPRYYWDYDFTMKIHVKHPYFDEMSFELNDSGVRIEPDYAAAAAAFGRPAMGFQFDPTAHPDYRQYVDMGNEIKAVLSQARQNLRDSINAAKAPKQRVNCPACGATTMPDAHGCCEYCGSALNR